jgi:general secretion pathway protein K
MTVQRDRGSMLVLVLFLAGLLSVFAAVAATAMRAAQNSSRAFADGLRAEEAARGAIEQAVAQSGGNLNSMIGVRTAVFGSTQVVMTVRGESARIDLNNAPAPLLAGLFRQFGVAPELADAYAARVLDWRDEDDRAEKGGAERAAYRAVGRVDGPRNGPFVHTAELGLVLGIPAAVAAAAAPYITVASGQGRINPMVAEPLVLLALPGAAPDRIRDFLARRADAASGFDALIEPLGPAQEFVTQEPGVAVRFEARVRLSTDTERRFEAVVYPPTDESEPFRILAWDASPPERSRAMP